MLEPRVTSKAWLGFYIFSNPSYCCMCNFVLGNKAHLALLPETKLRIQKCYTFLDIEKPSRATVFSQWYNTAMDLAGRSLHGTRWSRSTDWLVRTCLKHCVHQVISGHCGALAKYLGRHVGADFLGHRNNTVTAAVLASRAPAGRGGRPACRPPRSHRSHIDPIGRPGPIDH
jgi:hypothetical protein